MNAPRPDVIVVGGGVAGVSCALRLAQEGVRVLLLETRKRLGGRATSFVDVRTGETLDNCQHVALGCCVNYLDLCERLGVSNLLRWTDEIYWVEAGGRASVMRPGALPAPGHLAGSLLRASFLGGAEKRAISRAMLSILRARAAEGAFGAWLREHAQPPSAVRRFWEPVVVSACNLGVERVAANCAIKVFRDGFLASRAGARMCVAAVPLVRLYDPAEGAIRAAGGEVRLGVSVERIGENSVTTDANETIVADRVVCSLPPERAVRAIDNDVRTNDARLDGLERITFSPILGVHLTFDRSITDLPHAVLVERPTQWVFNKGAATDPATGATTHHMHAVISAADEWLPLSEEQIGQRVLEDVRACFPAANNAALLRVRAVKEKRATFAATPEVEALRPAVVGDTQLLLAGDYVQTGWPATMEGATRSGYLAAAAALGRDETWALRPDPPRAPLVRLLSAGE